MQIRPESPLSFLNNRKERKDPFRWTLKGLIDYHELAKDELTPRKALEGFLNEIREERGQRVLHNGSDHLVYSRESGHGAFFRLSDRDAFACTFFAGSNFYPDAIRKSLIQFACGFLVSETDAAKPVRRAVMAILDQQKLWQKDTNSKPSKFPAFLWFYYLEYPGDRRRLDLVLTRDGDDLQPVRVGLGSQALSMHDNEQIVPERLDWETAISQLRRFAKERTDKFSPFKLAEQGA